MAYGRRCRGFELRTYSAASLDVPILLAPSRIGRHEVRFLAVDGDSTRDRRLRFLELMSTMNAEYAS